jgi:hypothetical protein
MFPTFSFSAWVCGLVSVLVLSVAQCFAAADESVQINFVEDHIDVLQ